MQLSSYLLFMIKTGSLQS